MYCSIQESDKILIKFCSIFSPIFYLVLNFEILLKFLSTNPCICPLLGSILKSLYFFIQSGFWNKVSPEHREPILTVLCPLGWRRSVARKATRRNFGNLEDFWNFLEFFGIFWNFLEFFGIFWNFLEFFGIFWNFLEFFGIFWNF